MLYVFIAPTITYAQEFEVGCTRVGVVKNGKVNYDNPNYNDISYFTIDLNRKLLEMQDYILAQSGQTIRTGNFAHIHSIIDGIIYAQGTGVAAPGTFNIKYNVFEDKYEIDNYATNGQSTGKFYADCYDKNDLLKEFLKKDEIDTSAN